MFQETKTSDARLVREMFSGRPEAFSELVRRYLPSVAGQVVRADSGEPIQEFEVAHLNRADEDFSSFRGRFEAMRNDNGIFELPDILFGALDGRPTGRVSKCSMARCKFWLAGKRIA